MPVKQVLIVSPASARENNGNWHTASRWAHFLDGHYAVRIAGDWNNADPAPDILIALHARRSAPAVAAFAQAFPDRPCIVVLTGTDLYRDIAVSPAAQASLAQATNLVVLQDDGVRFVPPSLRDKVRVIYQSAPPVALPAPAPAGQERQVCMVGHLRDEKDPRTFMRAAALVTHPAVRLVHVGGALDANLGQAASATAAAHSIYRWLGPLPHADARACLARSHAMAICSLMEGGANVIIEAVTCGVPVLASDISGNRGMLGEDYAGYFPLGDAAALARLIDRSVADPDFYSTLQRQCAARAPLFAPERERDALLALLDSATGSVAAGGDAASPLAS